MTKLTWEGLWFEQSLDSGWGAKDLGENLLYYVFYKAVTPKSQQCYQTYKSPDAYSGEVPFDESRKFGKILFMVVAEEILFFNGL